MPPRVKGGTPIDRQIGAKLKRARLSCGMSLASVASRIGISSQAVHKYESGDNCIRAAMMQRLAQVYKMKVSELFP